MRVENETRDTNPARRNQRGVSDKSRVAKPNRSCVTQLFIMMVAPCRRCPLPRSVELTRTNIGSISQQVLESLPPCVVCRSTVSSNVSDDSIKLGVFNKNHHII